MVIAVCDDERIFRSEVLNLLEQYRKDHALSFTALCFSSAEELLRCQEKIDVVFLDIKMNGIDGMEAAGILHKRDKDIIIIFLTSHADMMQKAFEVRAFRYLIKPVEKEEFLRCMEAVKGELRTETVLLDEKNRQKIVKIRNILYIEAGNKNTIVRTEDNSYVNKNSMSDWEEMLEVMDFFRCHKTYLVNLAYVDEVHKEFAVLYNKERVSISRRNRKEFEQRLIHYIKQNAR